MTEDQPDLLTDNVLELNTIRRKQLLPWWIKIFMWLFLIFGLLSPFALVYGIFGSPFLLSLYGLETYEPESIPGIIILSLFVFKGITSYALLTEKDWAITFSIVDAGIGILFCIAIILYPLIFLEPASFVFRLELILLILYLLKMLKIKQEWESINPAFTK